MHDCVLVINHYPSKTVCTCYKCIQLADFAGGSFTCVMGILMALVERSTSGKGQIVDAAMVDGCAYLGSFLLSSQAIGLWSGKLNKVAIIPSIF